MAVRAKERTIMPSYLISFHTLGGKLGSHVVDLPEAPATGQAISDLKVCMGLEYGAQHLVLLNWDILPDSAAHPSIIGAYAYFLTYACITSDGILLGSQTVLRSRPICTLADLRFVEEDVRSGMQALEVHLVSCKALREPTAALLSEYKQLHGRK